MAEIFFFVVLLEGTATTNLQPKATTDAKTKPPPKSHWKIMNRAANSSNN